MKKILLSLVLLSLAVTFTACYSPNYENDEMESSDDSTNKAGLFQPYEPSEPEEDELIYFDIRNGYIDPIEGDYYIGDVGKASLSHKGIYRKNDEGYYLLYDFGVYAGFSYRVYEDKIYIANSNADPLYIVTITMGGDDTIDHSLRDLTLDYNMLYIMFIEDDKLYCSALKGTDKVYVVMDLNDNTISEIEEDKIPPNNYLKTK